MKKVITFTTLLLLALLLVSCGNPKNADDLINTPSTKDTDKYLEFRGEGIVDNNKYTNPAQAKLAAKEAALIDAQGKAVETIFGLKVEGGKSVEDFVLQDKTINAQFQGFIKGLKEVNSGITKDGIAWVTLRISKEDIEKTLGIQLLY